MLGGGCSSCLRTNCVSPTANRVGCGLIPACVSHGLAAWANPVALLLLPIPPPNWERLAHAQVWCEGDVRALW